MRGLKFLRAGFCIEGDVRALYFRFVGGLALNPRPYSLLTPEQRQRTHTDLHSVFELHARR